MSPVIEVSHLPRSSSFFAAVTQPLDLVFLSAGTVADIQLSGPPPNTPTGTLLHFGVAASQQIVFSLAQCPNPRKSSITFAASSPDEVTQFYNSAVKAIGPLRSSRKFALEDDSATARTADFDGNMIKTVYNSPGGVPTQTLVTTSTEKEARRVLHWQYDVASSVTGGSSVAGSAVGSDAGRAQLVPAGYYDAPPPLVRRETITTTEYIPRSSREEEKGISSKALIGTLLGAAAGAAVAYAMVKAEKDDTPPPPIRRSTIEPAELRRYTEIQRSYEPAVPEPPAYGYYEIAGAPRQHVPRYRVVPSVAPSRAPIELVDEDPWRSEVGTRTVQGLLTAGPPASAAGSYRSEREGSTASRSVAKSSHESVAKSAHGSTAKSAVGSVAHSSRESVVAKSVAKSVARSVKDDDAKSESGSIISIKSVAKSIVKSIAPSSHEKSYQPSAESVHESHASYRSAKSQASDATARPKTKSRASTTIVVSPPSKPASKAPTEVSRASRHSKDSHHSHRSKHSRHSTVVRAQEVALPDSVVEIEDEEDWEDTNSVLPSDSISQIGSTTSRRRRAN